MKFETRIRNGINRIVSGRVRNITGRRRTREQRHERQRQTPRQDHPQYFAEKYADALDTVRKYDKNAECVDLAAGYFAFWGKLANGYEVGVSNDDMDGVGDSQIFTTCLYRDGEFITHLDDGSLTDQLDKASTQHRHDPQE